MHRRRIGVLARRNSTLRIALPLATALSAIQLLRLFSWIFLGRHIRAVPAVADALARERWAFTAAAVFLITAGLVPQPVIASRAAAAHVLDSLVGPPTGERAGLASVAVRHP